MTSDRAYARSRPGRRSADPEDGVRRARVAAAERRIGAVAHLLDNLVAVPGTRYRIGLDPVIGLVPFLGDIAGALIAGWIVLEAARFGVPTVVLLRMMLYAVVDFAIGLVPLLGDVLDAGFKANTRNLELFHRHATDPGASTAGSTALLAGIALVFAGVIWAGIVLVGRLLSLVL
jgi:hypothetical protein